MVAFTLWVRRSRRGALGSGRTEEGVGAEAPSAWPKDLTFDHTGEPDDLPPWPTAPLTVIEGNEPEVVLRVLQAAKIEPGKLLLFVADDPEKVRERFDLKDATIFRLSRLEGESHISPSNVDRVGQLAELHLGRGKGRVVAIVPLAAQLSGAGLKSTSRLLQVLYEFAVTQESSILVFLNPRTLTVPELRLLEENATRIRVGGKPKPPPDDRKATKESTKDN